MRAVLLTLTLITGLQWTSGQNWVRKADFPGTPRDDAASFAMGGRVFVGTGRDESFALTNDWYAYSETLDEWAPIAALPGTGRQYCSAFSDGTHGYLFGGIDDNGPLNELWRYDPSADLWEQMASLPGPGRYASVVISNRFVATGLLEDGTATSDCWEYDPGLDLWTQRADVPGTPRHRASGGWSVIGGADAAYQALFDCYEYDVFNEVWNRLPDLPEPRYGGDAIQNILVGGASSDNMLHGDVWALRDGAWNNEPLQAFPQGVRRGGVIAGSTVPNGPDFYYGTGVDLLQRHSDWWAFSISATSIEDISNTVLNISPIPAQDEIRIRTVNKELIHAAVLYDAQGRVVMEWEGTADGVIRIDHLPAGPYVINAWTARNFYRATFIKQP